MMPTKKPNLTVRELKEILANIPDNAVCVLVDPDTCWKLIPDIEYAQKSNILYINAEYQDMYDPI